MKEEEYIRKSEKGEDWRYGRGGEERQSKRLGEKGIGGTKNREGRRRRKQQRPLDLLTIQLGQQKLNGRGEGRGRE